MVSNVRRAALLAAAKVALAGCGGTVAPVDAGGGDALSDDAVAGGYGETGGAAPFDTPFDSLNLGGAGGGGVVGGPGGGASGLGGEGGGGAGQPLCGAPDLTHVKNFWNETFETVSEDATSCCYEALDGATSLAALPEGQARDDAKVCCAALVAAVQTETEVASFDKFYDSVGWECCGLLDNPMSMACTPWGPPTPPAMKARGKRAATGAKAKRSGRVSRPRQSRAIQAVVS